MNYWIASNDFGYDAYLYALIHKHEEAIKLLKSDEDHRVYNCNSVNGQIMRAVLFDDHAKIPPLLEQWQRDPVYLEDNQDILPLFVAARDNKIECVKLLAQAKYHMNHICDDLTPLMQAVKDRNIEAIQILLEAGADINITNIHNKKAQSFICKITSAEDRAKVVALFVKYAKKS